MILLWLVIIAVLIVFAIFGMFVTYQSGYENGEFAGIRRTTNSYEGQLESLRAEHVCRTWTPWSSPERCAVWSGWRPTIERVQERTCLECNVEEVRSVLLR